MPLDYLSFEFSFKFPCGSKRDTDERLIHTKLVIVITANLEVSLYSEITHESATFKVTKG